MMTRYSAISGWNEYRAGIVCGLAAWIAVMSQATTGSAQFSNPFGGGAGAGAPRGPEEAPKYQAPVFEKKDRGEPVVAVQITGNEVIDESQIRMHLQTRVGRDFDPEVVRADVRRLSTTGMFRNVRTYRRVINGGVEVTFEVFELPMIRHLRFVGSKGIKEKLLRKESELKVGEPLQRFKVEEARRRLQELYKQKGYSDARVEIQEGINAEDQGVVFAIYEGERQRIFHTRFIGNTIAADSRLRTQIKSKPGIAWVFKGTVDREEIDADIERLTAYYRSLGYFRARVGRELQFSDSGKWLTITYVIDEGPRYKIRQVSVVGNQTFATESLKERLTLKSGDFFDSRRMNTDLNTLRDTYGGEGYIHADVKADPRFLEDPGMIDLVYDIQEGDQYRVGRIIVNIDGENPHTRRNVVINRLSLASNDIIDIREIRASERRLRSSNLFLSDPAQGVTPTIAIRPPELTNDTHYAEQPDATTTR
jgi:outer membrane protein insertion porin family